ncbi:molybdenum cofactor biosynthesis protein MoeA [Candidatus Magnetomorum sp. HK-1]|nr:molybdenum cofactor biosynthesis protein MoeA [Candidatus Magnetomorum sp. HK-1]
MTVSIMHLIDRWHRQLNYLRVSITDRCNLRCIYCQTGSVFHKQHHDDILRYEEILRVIKAGIALGITKVRITGGEPLVRRGVFPFLKEVTQLPGLEDISFTTNGVRLKRHISDILDANIRRINVSLDTLNSKKYVTITGADRWQQVWDGLIAAHEAGLYPIKLNVVAMNGINDDEWLSFANLICKYPFWVRFIELMPVGDKDLCSQRWVSSDTIKNSIESYFGQLSPLEKQVHDGPAERYKFDGCKGEIGFIHALSHHFCHTCNRLRLTANGNLRACLLSDQQIHLKSLLRNGCSDFDIQKQLMAAVKQKPISHQNHPFQIACSEQMVAIGG